MRASSRPRPSPPLPVEHLLFPTALGACGLAWTAHGLAWIQLPERSAAATRARLLRGTGPATVSAAPPSWVTDAVSRLTAHLAGAAEDLSPILLDMTRVPPFFRRVYEEARAVPRGQVRTYAELAALAGSPAAVRAVGQAMAKNPWPVVVPCHRVVGSGGKPGGFSAAGGLDTKARLLALEGAPLFLTGRRLKTRSAAS